MEINKSDTFLIGSGLAFSIAMFLEKNYLGILVQGFIIGTYFGFKYALQKDSVEVKE